MSPINVVVIDEDRPDGPDCAALLDQEQGIRIAARSSRAGDSDMLCATHQPDVLLLAIDHIRQSGPDWRERIREHCASTRVLLFGNTPEDEDVLDCLSGGARGCVERAHASLMGKAVRAVNEGEAWISRKLARRMIDRIIAHERYAG